MQYGCKAAANLVQLLQINKAGSGLLVLVFVRNYYHDICAAIHNPV